MSTISKYLGAYTYVRAHRIVVLRSTEAPSQFRYPSASLVDADNVASQYFLLLQLVDHLGAQVIDGLHVGRFQCQSTGLGRLSIVSSAHGQ